MSFRTHTVYVVYPNAASSERGKRTLQRSKRLLDWVIHDAAQDRKAHPHTRNILVHTGGYVNPSNPESSLAVLRQLEGFFSLDQGLKDFGNIFLGNSEELQITSSLKVPLEGASAPGRLLGLEGRVSLSSSLTEWDKKYFRHLKDSEQIGPLYFTTNVMKSTQGLPSTKFVVEAYEGSTFAVPEMKRDDPLKGQTSLRTGIATFRGGCVIVIRRKKLGIVMMGDPDAASDPYLWRCFASQTGHRQYNGPGLPLIVPSGMSVDCPVWRITMPLEAVIGRGSSFPIHMPKHLNVLAR